MAWGKVSEVSYARGRGTKHRDRRKGHTKCHQDKRYPVPGRDSKLHLDFVHGVRIRRVVSIEACHVRMVTSIVPLLCHMLDGLVAIPHACTASTTILNEAELDECDTETCTGAIFRSMGSVKKVGKDEASELEEVRDESSHDERENRARREVVHNHVGIGVEGACRCMYGSLPVWWHCVSLCLSIGLYEAKLADIQCIATTPE